MTNKPMLSVERDSIALEALKVARQFIANGIELGYIRMPEPETPDSAHGTLPMIDRAIVELRALHDESVPFPGYPPVPEDRKLPDVQRQGEPVAKAKPVAKLHAERLTGRDGEYGVTVEDSEWFNTCRLTGGIFNLYAEQPAPVAVELPERSSQDYAIEHAEYMAKSADGVLAKFQAYGLALLAVDEGGDDGEGELFEAIDSARGDLQEALVDLRSMVYEFRKRSAKSR